MMFQAATDDQQSRDRLYRALQGAGARMTQECKMRYKSPTFQGDGFDEYEVAGERFRVWINSWCVLVEGPDTVVERVAELYAEDHA
jgi:hypothetical protein